MKQLGRTVLRCWGENPLLELNPSFSAYRAVFTGLIFTPGLQLQSKSSRTASAPKQLHRSLDEILCPSILTCQTSLSSVLSHVLLFKHMLLSYYIFHQKMLKTLSACWQCMARWIPIFRVPGGFHLCSFEIELYFLHVEKQLFEHEQDFVLTLPLRLPLVAVFSADTSPPCGLPAILAKKDNEQSYFSLTFSIPRPSNSMLCGMW